MKFTRRQLIKALSYTGPMLATRPISAFAGGLSLTPNTDLVVYGGTASGVMTAYSAAREGVRVALLEPGSHLGGMVTGGLSRTDVGRTSVIGGYVREFYMKAAAHYGLHELGSMEKNWCSEPHLLEDILRAMLRDAGVTVHYRQRLRERDGVELHGGRIISITTEDGIRWPAKIFADCTYEGDLMAQAKVSYTWGREAASEYGEDLAGVRATTPQNQFLWPVSAYDEHHHLFPEVDPGPLAAPGSADKKVECYNIRLILSNDPANKLPFPRPEGYDRSRFALLERYLSEFPSHKGREPRLEDVSLPVAIPNHKADFNNNGGFGSDYIGHSWAYPEATYAQREAIWKDHLLYIQSLYYFISQDPKLPASLREGVNKWGPAKDEFADTGHWPHQLYIREARRMVGAYVVRQADLQGKRTKADSIGMGSYNIDTHNVQRIAMPDGTAQNEGDIQVPVEPYEIPYRSITPKRSQADNLLVTVCLSVTHVACGSVRMEPQYMILGEAAGTAASLAVKSQKVVQDISISDLQRRLREHGAVLHLSQEFPFKSAQ